MGKTCTGVREDKLPVGQQLLAAQHHVADPTSAGRVQTPLYLTEMHKPECRVESRAKKKQDASNLLLFLPVNLVLKIFAWGRRKKGGFKGCQLNF